MAKSKYRWVMRHIEDKSEKCPRRCLLIVPEGGNRKDRMEAGSKKRIADTEHVPCRIKGFPDG